MWQNQPIFTWFKSLQLKDIKSSITGAMSSSLSLSYRNNCQDKMQILLMRVGAVKLFGTIQTQVVAEITASRPRLASTGI